MDSHKISLSLSAFYTTKMDYSKFNKPDIGRGCSFAKDEMGETVAMAHPGCYKLHETPWMADYPVNLPTDIFEIRFKNTRRSYYRNVNDLQLEIGDIVAVEGSPGHDIGVVSLTGDMVAKQMRRVGFNPFNGEYKKIFRKARPYDIERWQEAIALEHETMIRSRQIAAEMGLDMKIGDVEYQGDGMKAIFYYIADGRVDFRELIKVFADQFRIRIEMKQIGARQEAGRIGGIGACGRELCCASWIAGFSSVTTNAARVQDISPNPLKLAGQCSKLKCCLMYEYDVYADARRSMPRVKEPLQAMDGEYFLVKSDILAHTMTFSTSKDSMVNCVTVPASRVRDIIFENRAGRKVDSIALDDDSTKVEEPTFKTEEDSITRFDKAKKKKNRSRDRRKGQRDENRPQEQNNETKAEVNSESQPQQIPAQETQANRREHDRRHRDSRDRRENRPEVSGGENAKPVEASAAAAQPEQSQQEATAREHRHHGRNNHRHRNRNHSEHGSDNGNTPRQE